MKKKKKNSAGRKALPPGKKKTPLVIFPEKDTIDKCGGPEISKEIAQEALTKKANEQ